MKSIRELVDLIPEHIIDMDLEKTFLVGITTTDISVQVDKLNELGVIVGQLSDENALVVLKAIADNFNPEFGVGNELIRSTIVDLLQKGEIALA